MITECVRICGKVPWNVLFVAKGTFSDIQYRSPLAVSRALDTLAANPSRLCCGSSRAVSPIRFPVRKRFSNKSSLRCVDMKFQFIFRPAKIARRKKLPQ